MPDRDWLLIALGLLLIAAITALVALCSAAGP
jgi:hypothetical protein